MIIGGKESRRDEEEEEWKWKIRKTWKMKKKEDQKSFCEIWYHLNVEQHVIALVTNMKESVLVDRITLRNIGTKPG